VNQDYQETNPAKAHGGFYPLPTSALVLYPILSAIQFFVNTISRTGCQYNSLEKKKFKNWTLTTFSFYAKNDTLSVDDE